MNWSDSILGRYSGNVDPVRTERMVELGVLAAALVLCLQLLYSVGSLMAVGVPAAVAPAQDALTVRGVRTHGMVTAEQRLEILSRPLFWASRRPEQEVVAPAPVAAQEKAAAELKGVKLLGVFGSGETAGLIALVKGKKQRILQGEELEGWTLESVEANRVVLLDGARRSELVLHEGIIQVPVDAELPGPREASSGEAELVGQQEATSGDSENDGDDKKTPSAPLGLGFGGSPK